MEWHILKGDALTVAPKLLGSWLERDIGGKKLVVKIVEVEAYDHSDEASHSYNGETPRTKVMFGPPGHLYVYFTYGMHYCCNIVVGEVGHGSAVLIRAVEPISGLSEIEHNRGKSGIQTTNGPAKLCQALKINKDLNGHNLKHFPLKLILKPVMPADEIVQTTRIGISKGQNLRWRFYIKDNPFVSYN